MSMDADDRAVRASAYEIAEFRWGNFGRARDGDVTARDGGRKAEGSGASSTGAKGAAGGESRGPTIQQGEAVDKALDGKRNLDIDRWSGFSRAAAEKLASEPAPPADAQKPKAGLARDGGLVEGES